MLKNSSTKRKMNIKQWNNSKINNLQGIGIVRMLYLAMYKIFDIQIIHAF